MFVYYYAVIVTKYEMADSSAASMKKKFKYIAVAIFSNMNA